MIPAFQKLIIYRSKNSEQRVNHEVRWVPRTAKILSRPEERDTQPATRNKPRTAAQTYRKGARQMKAWEEPGLAKIS